LSETPVYFAVVDGQQQGPLPREALAEWFRQGRLRPEDLVWESGTPDWLPASTLFGASSLADVPLAEGPAAPGPVRRVPGPVLGPLPPPIARARAKAGAVLRDLASLPAADVLPFGRLRDPETLGAPAAWPLLVFGLAPLLLVALVEDAAWRVRLFHLGCGAAWTVFFWRGFSDDVPPRRWGPAFLSGAVLAGVLFFAHRVPPLSWLASGLGDGRSLLVNALSAGALGLVWAGAVALVLVLLMGGRAVRSDRPGDASAGLGLTLGLFLGVGAGVARGVLTAGGFSAGEAPSLAAVLAAPSLSLYAALVTTVVKISLLPVLHGAWGAASGVFAGSFLAEGKRPAFLVVGIAIPAILFGLFELSVARNFWPGTFLVSAVSLLAFLAWHRAAGGR
jgi:hypothetical protein